MISVALRTDEPSNAKLALEVAERRATVDFMAGVLQHLSHPSRLSDLPLCELAGVKQRATAPVAIPRGVEPAAERRIFESRPHLLAQCLGRHLAAFGGAGRQDRAAQVSCQPARAAREAALDPRDTPLCDEDQTLVRREEGRRMPELFGLAAPDVLRPDHDLAGVTRRRAELTGRPWPLDTACAARIP